MALFGLISSPKVDTSAQDRAAREAALTRFEENQREGRINAGLRDIASIFDGGVYRAGVDDYTPPSFGSLIGGLLGAAAPGSRFAQPEQEEGFLKSRFGLDGLSRTFGSADEASAFRDQLLEDILNPEVDRLNLTVPARQIRDRLTNQALRAEENEEPFEPSLDNDLFGLQEIKRRKSDGIQPFLEQRQQALQDFYLPQLDEQFEDASDSLTNALARSGLLRSSVANDRSADLDTDFALQGAQIGADISRDISDTATRFNRERSAAEASLRASGDRGSAIGEALRGFANIRDDVPEFSVLPSLFAGITDGIGAAAQGFQAGQTRRRLDQAKLDLRGAGKTIG